MKFVCLALLAFAIAVSAIDASVDTSAADQNAVELLDSLREQISAHGVASLEAAPTQEPSIGVSFKWSKVDVKNFLAWLVDQKANAGTLDSLLMNSGKTKKPMSAKMRKLLKKLRALKALPSAGEHGGLWWYKVQCDGGCLSNTIRSACSKYDLKPACNHNAYSDGMCVNSNYNQGRHLSYPPHHLESWQYDFFRATHTYCGSAYSNYPLQESGGSHRWSYGESGNTVCVSDQKPQFHLLKKYKQEASE